MKVYYEKIDYKQRKLALEIARIKGLEELRKAEPLVELTEVQELNFLVYKCVKEGNAQGNLFQNHIDAIEKSIYDRLGRSEVL